MCVCVCVCEGESRLDSELTEVQLLISLLNLRADRCLCFLLWHGGAGTAGSGVRGQRRPSLRPGWTRGGATGVGGQRRRGPAA